MTGDTLGHLLSLHVTPASQQDRDQAIQTAQAVQETTGRSVELAYVDQGYTGERPVQGAAARGTKLEMVKLLQVKRGLVLLPRRWVVERPFAWLARFRRLAKDHERLPKAVAGLHFIAFVCIMLGDLMAVVRGSS